MNIQYLNIIASEIPTQKVYSINGINYIFDFKYNDYGQFYSVEIYDQASNSLVTSNKIVYGVSLINVICSITLDIIPYSINLIRGERGTEDINSNTLGNEIKLMTGMAND